MLDAAIGGPPPPFQHQVDIMPRLIENNGFGILWEQGCGKTRPMIDDMFSWATDDQIKAALVIAPNGVHRNWVTDELPTHQPLGTRTVYDFYESSRAGTKKHQARMNRLFTAKGPLPILTMSYEAFITKRGMETARRFYKEFERLYVALDESHYIKTPSARRTKSIHSLGKKATVRRIMTGTPVAGSPFDLYSQMKFINPDIWRPFGCSNYAAFKRYFGVWQDNVYGPGIHKLIRYRNLDELTEIIRPHTHRLTKAEALPHLPEKLYSKIYVDLSNQQRSVYHKLRDEFMLELDNGEILDASMAVVRLLRLQQVLSGYLPNEEGAPQLLDGKCPRLETLRELCSGLTSPAIIWARFRTDVDRIVETLSDLAPTVRYDGAVSDEDRAKAKLDFQKGRAKFFVGNPAAGATGLTLTAARTVIYYSNDFRLLNRLQSEDRAHRIGQRNAVNYVDLITEGTIDEHIVRALRSKFDIASQLTGDKMREWI